MYKDLKVRSVVLSVLVMLFIVVICGGGVQKPEHPFKSIADWKSDSSGEYSYREGGNNANSH